MKSWCVTVYASEEFYVNAETREQAEELAAEESSLNRVDYCEAEEVILD